MRHEFNDLEREREMQRERWKCEEGGRDIEGKGGERKR